MKLNLPRQILTVNTGYSIPEDVAEFIVTEAKRLRLSRSALVTAIVKAYIEQGEIDGEAEKVRPAPMRGKNAELT